MMWLNAQRQRRTVKPRIFQDALCLALGAAAMYYLDPEKGRRRRALMRDSLTSSFADVGNNFRKTVRYTRDCGRGIVASARARMTSDSPDDHSLIERVRSAMGRAVTHPGNITVTAHDGVVTMTGRAYAEEIGELLRTVGRVRGVRHVVNRLDVHEHKEEASGNEENVRHPHRFPLLQDNWNPLLRWTAALGGSAMSLWGLLRRDALGLLSSGVGLAFATRAVSNLPFRRLTGIGAGHRAIDVHKTITIRAPIDRVFNFFANYENFPHFMENVRSVRALSADRSHWEVGGPMGSSVSWDAELTDYRPNEAIGWRTAEGATVQNAGVIQFQQEPGGATRLDIRLTYNPPAGALGHTLARVFGADPKSELDVDLARVKTALETGHFPRDASKPLEAAV